MKALVVKAIQFLLIARVLAAPVALRPATGEDASGAVLVVRVCAWPAHQSRVTSASITEGRDGGGAPSAPAVSRTRRTAHPATAADRPLCPFDDYARRSLWRLRC